MEESEVSKVFNNEDFGYWAVTVERPLRLRVYPERKIPAGVNSQFFLPIFLRRGDFIAVASINCILPLRLSSFFFDNTQIYVPIPVL